MRISFKTIACGVAAFVVGLIALVGLTSAIVNIDAVVITLKENGFDMFGFESIFSRKSRQSKYMGFQQPFLGFRIL